MGFTEQSAIPAESTSNNFPVEKPADKPYLRSRISHLLAQAEAEPDNLERWNIYQRIRELTRGLRTPTKGHSIPWPLGFAAGFAAVAAFGIFWITRAPDLWHVLDRASDYDQTLQQIHNGHPQTPVVMHWCPGNPQPFEPGQTLTDFGFEYHSEGWCSTNTKFSLLRDAAHCPVVPANCWHTTSSCDPMTDHILCVGKPQFE